MLRKREYEYDPRIDMGGQDRERARFLYDEVQAREAEIRVLKAQNHALANEVRELRTLLHRRTKLSSPVEAREGLSL